MTQALMTRETVRTLFSKQRDEIAKALPTHVNADTFIRVILTAINKTPKLMECTQESLMGCAMDLAQLGLVADSVMGLGYLIPFQDSRRGMICTLIIGVQGYVDLAYRSNKVKAIRWNPVYEKDKFDYAEGFDAKLVHVPCDEEDPGPLTHAYAICDLADGGRTWSVMNRRDIMKIKASSKSAGSQFSPWSSWEPQMWCKTAVKSMLKRVPKSRELADAYAKDADDAVIDVASQVMNQTPTIADHEVTKETPQPDPAPAAVPLPKEAPVAAAPAAPASKSKKAAVPAAAPAKEVGPTPDMFTEGAAHKTLRQLMTEAGISEAHLLQYLRDTELCDESVSDIKMIPHGRVEIINQSWDSISAEAKVQ